MKKILLAIAVCAASVLFAAIDARRSYFTVSTHAPGVNVPVEITVVLRDGAGQPAETKSLRSKPAAEFKQIGKGIYRAQMVFAKSGEKVTPQIFAGKVRVRENLLPDKAVTEYARAYSSRRGMTELAFDNGRLRIINLTDEKAGSRWFFGSLGPGSFRADRRYLLSADIESVDVISGKGAALFMSCRNAAGKSTGGRYGISVRNEKKFISSLLVPRGKVVSADFGVHSSYSEGKTFVSDPRLEVIPTFIVQETPGGATVFTPATPQEHIYPDYRRALTAVLEKRSLARERAVAKGAELPPAAAVPKGKIDASTAHELKKSLYAEIKELENRELENEKKSFERGLITPAKLRLIGDQVRAAVASKADVPPEFHRNFVTVGAAAAGAFEPGVAFNYDEKNLYVTVDVPGKPNILKGSGKHDDKSLWKRAGDKVELFINIPGTRSYAQFAVGPGGQKYDESDKDAFVNYRWDADIKLAAEKFTVRFTIPWQEVNINIREQREIRLNCAVSKADGKRKSSYCWSFANAGYRELDSMGFVVLDKFPAGVTDFIAYKNDELRRKHAADTADAGKLAAEMNTMRQLVSFNWDENQEFEKDPVSQMRLLSKFAASPAPADLKFQMAVNEFAHRAFTIGAGAEDVEITPEFSDLRSGDGKVIPAAKLSLAQILFLEPRADIYPRFRQKWSGRPLPELVEKVSGKVTVKRFSLAMFRLYIDSRDCQAGTYRGSVKLGSLNIPVSCRIIPLTLPPCEAKPLNCYIFTSMPWNGPSGEAWAKLLQEHYVGDVSFEHPKIYVDGKLAVPYDVVDGKFKGLPWRWEGYKKQVLEYRTPAGAKVVIDGKLFDFDDRVKICAKYNLRIVMSNRAGFLFMDHLPLLVEHLKKLGLPPQNFVYKLGDEDPGPYFLPVAKHIRSMNLGININMIPSGAEYWDLKPLTAGFTCLDYSSAAMHIDEVGRRDLQIMRKSGFPIRRYTNQSSWAERAPRLASRHNMWDVIIGDDLDGMVVWTASPSCWLNYSLGYGSNRRIDWRALPPENQHTCQLMYWRKQGDFIKPIASMRLEDMRDGATDALYYRAVREQLTRRGDRDGLQKLAAIVKRPKRKFSDFERDRNAMYELLKQK